MAEKQFLDTDGLQTLWGRVKSEDAKVLDSRMARDGSNYEGSLLLVTPTISDYRWTIKAQNGTTKSTITNDLSIQVENGAKVDFAGIVADPKIVAPGYALPEEKDGDWGTLTSPQSASLSEVTKDSAKKSLTVNYYKQKGGLEVKNNKVVKAEGKDKTTATATVQFLHRRYWGVSAEAAVDIKTLQSELSNSRAKTINYDCSGGKYFYYAYPKALGESTWKVGGLAFSGYERTEKTITNEYGEQVVYYVYRSTNKQTGASINAVIS